MDAPAGVTQEESYTGFLHFPSAVMYVCTTWYVSRVSFLAEYDQPDMVANSARGQLNRKTDFSLSPFARDNLVWRDRFGRPVPRRPGHSPYTG